MHDALTGIRNRNAYERELKRLRMQVAVGYRAFGFVVIDLNRLKHLNDTYGHDRGNAAICACCELTCGIFAHSPVFRIGGDEFVVILERRDYENVESLAARFNAAIEENETRDGLKPWERVSAALGYALYDPAHDEGVEAVFKRADAAMYERKVQMKATRED